MPKRTAILMFALMLLSRAYAACVVQTDVLTALTDRDGKVLAMGDGVRAAFEVRADALYAFGAPGDYRLMDGRGEQVSDLSFEMIYDAGDALIFRQDGLYGAMDADGRVVVEPVWTQLMSTGGGGFIAMDGDPLDEQADEARYLVPGQEAVPTGVRLLGGLSLYSEGLMASQASDGRWGCLDERGNVAIPFEWIYLGRFENGLATASDGEGRGLVDRSGQTVVPLRYAWIGRSDELTAGLSEDGGVDVYGPDGGLLYTIDGQVLEVEVVGGYVIVYREDASGVYDPSGSCVLEGSTRALYAKGLNGQLVVADGAWGEACQRLMAPDGSDASPAFQRLLPLCGGRYACMTMGGAEYLSDDLNGVQTSWDYDSVRYGLMDDAGNALLPAEYRQILVAGDDRLTLVGDDYVALADLDGHVIRRWDS